MKSGFIFALLASVTWGLAYTLDQKVLERLSPLTLISFSYLMCFLLTVPFLFFEDKSFSNLLSIDRKTLFVFLISITLTFAANYFILVGIKDLDASTASVVEITYPIFVILFSFLIFRTIPNYIFLVGTTIVILGVGLIVRSGN